MKIEHRTTILDIIPMHLVQYHSKICHMYLWANSGHPRVPTASCTHNNTQHTTKNRKHCHHGSPKPPASNGFKFTGECNRHKSRDQYRSPQYGNVTFINKTNSSVILFTIILQGSAWRTRGQKVTFYKLLLMLFCTTALEQHALTSAIRWYFICQCSTSTSHVSVWFRTRGGVPLSQCFQEER